MHYQWNSHVWTAPCGEMVDEASFYTVDYKAAAGKQGPEEFVVNRCKEDSKKDFCGNHED